MKFYTNSTSVKFRWDQVSNAVFKRYPNPWSKHVLSEDVISRKVDGPILRTVRILTKTNKAPKFASRFVPTSPGCVIEESHINAKEKTIVTYTRNLCYKHIMEVDERCEYKVSPDSKSWTLLTRQAWISSSLYGFARAIESLGVERYKKNIKKSVKGLEYILTKMYIPDKIPCSINTTVPIPHTM
ncbi:PRELI domain-containing protein 1, mitochondrial-like [Hydractinia symbiolongicarpus]|uniref:PRELI domain-containing protein 1, mitochondrial-like n=1 Tax=Hydractinia symbiolongicarpus TaxID=13093 RepID=UPI00254AD953|nr:PRELI domain-containing protein 1, mitochondrial-like [Hydractinia symbiolongicarpus]